MYVRLGEICDFQSGGTPSKNNQKFFDGDIPWITTVALKGLGIDGSDAVNWITEEAIKQSAAKIVPANSIMIGTRVGVGKVAINLVDMSTSQDIVSLIGIDETRWCKEYLCKCLIGKSQYLNSQARGATIKGIKIDTLANLKIPEISIEKQYEVSRIIDKTRIIIEQRKQELMNLNELMKARFVEMFGDPIRNTQNRPTTEFINVVKMQRGFDLPVQDRQQDGEIPVYGSNGALDYHNVAKIHGGVITGRSGTIGKVFYTEGDFWPLNTSLFSADTHGNNVIYLGYLLQLFDLTRFVEGTGVPTLNRNMFHNKQIIDVPIDEQRVFAAFVNEIDKSKSAVKKALDETQLLFDSLMQEYFG